MTTPVNNLIRKVFLRFINSGEPYLKTRLIAKVYTEITGNKKYDYLGYESRNPSMHRITNIYKELINENVIIFNPGERLIVYSKLIEGYPLCT